MIRLSLAAALISLSAMPSLAMSMNERPELMKSAADVMTVERRAGDLLETRELVRRGLSADDIITVTELPTTGRPADFSSRNGG
ncbi:hypothetical protein [Paracoccus sp. ME4]|uniref:hypothetical protein n=1 Tax=Paracoccus sp. ME4 TaxID=3138066 RepID=UPI00398B2E78